MLAENDLEDSLKTIDITNSNNVCINDSYEPTFVSNNGNQSFNLDI